MGKTLSEDLRVRVIAAIDGGLSRDAAAARFGVAVSTAVRWARAWRETGATTAKPKGGRAATCDRTGSRRIATQSSRSSKRSRTLLSPNWPSCSPESGTSTLPPAQRPRLPSLRRAGARAHAAARRSRRHGQLAAAQAARDSPCDRGGGCEPALPSAILPRLQSDRERLRQAQGAAPESVCTNTRRPLGRHPRRAAQITPAECENYFTAAGYEPE